MKNGPSTRQSPSGTARTARNARIAPHAPAHNPLLGIGLMVVAMALLTAKDGTVKVVGQQMSPFFLIWLQYALIFLVVAALCVPKYGIRALIPKPFGLQLLRGGSAIAALGLSYYAFTVIPLADAVSVGMSGPLIVTLLSPVVLGEHVGWRRWAAVLVGFAGILLILRPAFEGPALGYWAALATGFFFGLHFLGNRMLSGRHPALLTVAHSVIAGVVLAAPAIPFIAPPGSAFDFSIAFILFVVLSVIGQFFLINAFAYGDASIVAPFQYLSIVFGVIIGLVFFGEFPLPLTWAGVALVIASGIYLALRESRTSKHPQKLPGAGP